MMCFWGEEIQPAGFGLVKADSVNLTETGIGFISPKSSIRGVCEGKDQILFVRGEGIVSVLKLNTGANCRCAKLKPLELKKEKIRLISCGEAHAVLLAYGGKVLFMDESNICRPIKELCNRTVIQVACGNQHSMALTNDGQLFTWGQNSRGQLGLGLSEPQFPQPVKSLFGIPLAQISAGGDHSFALSMSGTVFGWGKNNAGQLGLGHTEDVCIPTRVSSLSLKKAISISCGEEHTATLSKGGTVFTFGSGSYGQLGHNSFRDERQPRVVNTLWGLEVSQITCGRHHTIAWVKSSKMIYLFGCGEQGQLGNGQRTNQCVPIPVQLPSEVNDNHTVKNITAGGNHSFVLCSSQESGNNSERNQRRGIVTLGENMIKRWVSECDSKQWRTIKKEIKQVFSSTACLNGSFIKTSDDRHYQTYTHFSGLDLDSVRSAFDQLAKKEKVLTEVEKVIDKDLLPSLDTTAACVDALRVYLILPELIRVLNNHQATFAGSLTRSILKLHPHMLSVLESYWSELPDIFLKTLVELFHDLSVKLVAETGYGHERRINTSLMESVQILQMVYQASCKSQSEIPPTDFIIHEVNELFDMLKTIQMDLDQIYWGYDLVTDRVELQANERYLKDTVHLLISSPCIFNLEAKYNLLKYRHVRGTFTMNVRRTSLLEDCFNLLRTVNEQTLKCVLQVIFCENLERTQVNRKDFFYDACKKLLAPESTMFVQNDTKSLIWFPAEPSVPDERYFLLGILCGLALYNNNVVNLPFLSALFKKLLDIKPSLQDFAELSPIIAQSLQYILNYPDDDVENMDMYYTIKWNNKEVELDPDEPGKLVTSSNRKQFVDAYVDYVLNISVEKVFEEFKRGFYEVCDQDLVKLFRPEELRGVMLGTEEYDWNILKQNATYEGLFDEDHPTVVLFWKVFDELSDEDKKLFLLFLTGVDRVPILGMDQVKMRVRPLLNSTQEHMPQAITCHSILELPMYQTKKIFRMKLTEAIHHKRGFWQE